MKVGKPNPTATLFGFSFLSTAAYVLTRALGVSLLMARVGSEALPLALSASAIAVIAISFLTRFAVRYANHRLCLMVTWFALGVVTLILSLKIVTMPYSFVVVGTIFVLAEVRGCLNTVYSTTMANDFFADSTTARPFVLVFAGAPIAGILAGFLLSYEASVISATTWLAVIAGLDAMTMLLSCFLPDWTQPKNEALSVLKAPPKTSNRLQHYRYRLAALVALKVIVLTLVGYQWNVVVNDYLLSEEKMIRYFAAFYAISDGLILLIQLAASGKLLDRFGIGVPLRMYPVCLAVMGLAAVASDSLPMLMLVFTVGSGLNVLRRALHDPGLAAAYSILDPRIRSETIVLVTGMIKPFAEFIAALGLLFYADFVTANVLTWAWIGLLLPWFYFANWVSRRFVTVRDASPS
ncbi:hypothetical protein LF1_37400 [Rubripirellula obstinata]|uniref:Major Facilitator Superfamily protein n=1 Tax=Rubripirellula obstinata TaxID=406547 RepID=A0A5B1CPI3_9BACT|nr:hypothetical protein [Rubripirellula obstinata]KAA1261194.1 hypothetical protein LF1_37400 [Rubripirellula obstinata]